MGVHEENRPALPIKATPYRHQIEAYRFACGLFGLLPGGGNESGGCALLMEMGTGKTITSIAITGALPITSVTRKEGVFMGRTIQRVNFTAIQQAPKQKCVAAYARVSNGK